MKARLPLIAALAVTLAPLKASAQAWVSNPDFSEGIGIRAGNLELHPSVGAEAGYDSNFFRSSKAEGVVDVYKFRVTPSLTLGTLGSKRAGSSQGDIAFHGGAYASYYEIVAADSANSDVSNRRNVGLGADAKLDIFPHRKLGFDLAAAYVRVIDAEGTTENLTGDGFLHTGFNRDTLRGAAGVSWRPGGGLFEWRGGYSATYHFFENDTYSTLNNLQHEISTRGRWRFLPRSALLFDTSYTFIRYTHSDTQLTGGDTVRSRIGVHSLVTYHLALMGLVGWAASFYEGHPGSIAARQYDSLIANAEARWFIQSRPNLDSSTITSGLSSVALGYTRSFSNSYYGSFYQRDRGYLQFSMFILGAVAAGLEFGVSRVAYPEVQIDPDPNPRPAFAQARIDGRLFAEYRFTETIAANGTLQFDQLNGPTVNGEDLDFTRWQAYLGVRWFM